MRTNDERRRAVLQALGDLPAAELRAAAEACPEPLGAILRELAGAMDDPADPGRLERLLDEASADAVISGADLDRLIEASSGELQRIARSFEVFAEPARRLDESTGQLADGAEEWVEAMKPHDVELAEILERALAATRKLGEVTAIVGAVAKEGPALARSVAELLQKARRAPEAVESQLGQVATRIRNLEATARVAESARERVDDLIGILVDLRDLAVEREHPVAADIAAFVAAVREEAGGEGVLEDWRQAFNLAARYRMLQLARATGQRTQLIAIERGDLGLVAAVSRVLGDLAQEAGDLRGEVLARLEQVTVTLRRTGDADEAQRAVEQLQERVKKEGGTPSLRARLHLTLGQILTQRGDLAEARSAYRRVLKLAVDRKSFPRELGRAALLLATLEAGHQPNRARKHLQLAREVGRDTDDWPLYAPAVLALTDALVQDGRDAAVPPLLDEARQVARRIGPDAWAPLDGQLQERWGQERVEAWLRAVPR
ncbi:MAG: tetratricopeptide repeat protein [Deltaproteobacteria bacterium]|nr:tetratricopeptide repeat protein [Deltaproteobacteria bacterium]MBW2253452.1 tetratricopeptide repeat protein [Deltaproteobacteria bacterium]